MPRPDFFIVGAPKSGTTAMYTYLRDHPDIYMARKEMHYFGKDLVYVDGAAKAPLRDEPSYLAQFDGWNGEARIGEASVWYLLSKTAAQEIKAFSPDASIIIMLRNPIDMMYSLYFEHIHAVNEDQPSFEAALAAETERKAGRRIPPSAHIISGLFYRDVARYSEQVQRYFDTFDRDQVYVIIFDDFKEDTAREYTRALKFLGVNPTPATQLHVVNPAKMPRNHKLNMMLKYPKGTPWYARIRALTPPFIRRPISTMLHKWITVPLQKPPLDPVLRAELQREFLPDVEKLSTLLGRDLTHWCRSNAN